MSVTIPKKSLRRVLQVAKETHSQNVEVTVSKGKVSFLCETGEIVVVEGIKA